MSGPQSKSTKLLNGQFRDGPFIGLDYRTASQKGVTNEEGKFLYQAGEVVTFSIGNLTIGSAAGAPSLTLAALHDGDGGVEPDLTRPETVNRARFIQSLGREADLHSGVSIDRTVCDVVSAHADGTSFASDVDSFEQAPSVRSVFSKLGRRLRGAAEARNHVRRALAGIRAFRDVRIPTSDGSYLLADVFRPNDTGRYPVLLRLSVYGRAFKFGSIFSEADHEASEELEAAWFDKSRDEINFYFRYSENAVSANASTWVPRGYALVWVDGRGVGHTPGILDPFSKQEALDYYDAIEWAAEQPWSDGKVGLYGGSYNATIQWNVAALHPPSLKAIAPIAGDGDAYRDLAYPGGIFLEKYRRWWWTDTVGSARNPKAGTVDFISGLVSHPFDDEHYHGDGILSADFASIDIPVITAVSQTGWIHARSGFEAFSQLSSPSKKLLVLDAAYTSYMYEDCQPDLEAFFDRHLKGEEPAQDPSPVRIVLRTGDGGFQWRDAPTWPLPGTDYRELFLDVGDGGSIGRLTARSPRQKQAAEYSADVQGPAKDLPMAVFESAPLDEDLELAGHFRATLWVASTSSDADVFVALRVIDGEREVPYRTREPGSVAPLTWGCLKVSHRAIDPTRSTSERPWHTHRREDALLLSPDEVVKVDVELMPATGRIPAGRRLRIEISPVEGRGGIPGWERAYDESYHRDAVNPVFTGGLSPSSITIPVVPRQYG
jgi:predicted acyl esterase